MTFSDILNALTRKSRALAAVERIIEVGATIILTDGRMGKLELIAERDYFTGARPYGWVTGDNFAAWITEDDIFIYRNAQ